MGLWELLNGGCVFYALSSRIIIFTDMQDIPVPNVIPKVLLDVICRLESDELQFTWKLSRNKDGFSLSVNQVKVPAKRDSRDPGKTTVDVEAKPLKKTKKKSPSTLAHDRARRKRYRKKKAALKAASRQREQKTWDSGKGETAAPSSGLDSVAPHLAEELASHCDTNELKHLTSESDSVQSVPIHSDLDDLSETEHQGNTTEQEFLEDLIETLEADSTIDSDDEVLPKKTDTCANCRRTLGPERTSCKHCQVTHYCNIQCCEKDYSFHRFACSVAAKRSKTK